MAYDINAGNKKQKQQPPVAGYQPSLVERTTTPMYGGRMYYRPSTVTAQEQGILSNAEVQRRANSVEETNRLAAQAKARSQQQSLMDALTNMFKSSSGQINTAYDDLSSMLNNQTNPYANMQAQSVQATPQLQELLQSQGVSSSPLQQLAAVTQAQNTGQATAYSNLIGSLSGMWNAGQEQQQQNVSTMRNQALQDLSGQTMGYGSKLLGKKQPEQQALIQLINALSGRM
jgi:hypothetical protein